MCVIFGFILPWSVISFKSCSTLMRQFRYFGLFFLPEPWWYVKQLSDNQDSLSQPPSAFSLALWVSLSVKVLLFSVWDSRPLLSALCPLLNWNNGPPLFIKPKQQGGKEGKFRRENFNLLSTFGTMRSQGQPEHLDFPECTPANAMLHSKQNDLLMRW